MPLARRLREFAAARLRTMPAALRAAAAVRRVRHERRVRAFLSAGDGRAGAFPQGLVFEPTMRCNLRCAFCYVGSQLNRDGEWPQELPPEILARIFPARAGLQINLTGGEIFVRKDILEVLDLFRRKHYVCGYLTTNGVLIDSERAAALADLAASGFLKHISLSVDGPAYVHDEARGIPGTFERAAAALGRLQAAARARKAPLRLSLNTTVTRESLDTLDRMADVAAELGVDAIGLNHLMFATAAEVAETARLLGTDDDSLLSTFVTGDPGVPADVADRKVRSLVERCRQRGIRFDARPRLSPGLMASYYAPGAPLDGRCLYPFLNARVSFSGKVYFCPFIRLEVGDLRQTALDAIWNSDRYVELRRRLLEQRLFPICRRCCKVELSREGRFSSSGTIRPDAAGSGSVLSARRQSS